MRIAVFGSSSTAKSILPGTAPEVGSSGPPLLHQLGHGNHRPSVRGIWGRMREETKGNVCAGSLGSTRREAATRARSLRKEAAALRDGWRTVSIWIGNQGDSSCGAKTCGSRSPQPVGLFALWLHRRSIYLLQEHKEATARTPPRIF